MKNKRRLTPKQWFFGSIIHIWLGLIVLAVLIPVLWIVGSSFGSSAAIVDVKIIPTNPTIRNYVELLTETGFPQWFRNTLIIAVLTMVCSAVLNMFTAFIFARFPFKGRKPLLMFIMIFTMFPSFLGLTAIYVIALNFGLLDNIYTLVIIYTAGSIPGNIFLARGYLLNIPRTIDEAAYIDGASKIQVFRYIVLPLSIPIMAFLALTAFMGPWFDYIMPRLLLSSNENLTIAIELFNWTDPQSPLFNLPRFAAASIMIALPITALSIFFQRFIVTGLTAGANKGE
ncbi:MAG: ABC transporter permease subunit [Oscillospiraceae bacterium]|jgi:arabinogalactan oligomer/maltooligosaccharide transport system permease protein|nr:ABC transporter permease subunit [Oscillospiraceae bacterium]